jgi:hypothetical protein
MWMRGLNVTFDGIGATIKNLFNIASVLRLERSVSRSDHNSVGKANDRRVRHTMVSKCGEQTEVIA